MGTTTENPYAIMSRPTKHWPRHIRLQAISGRALQRVFRRQRLMRLTWGERSRLITEAWELCRALHEEYQRDQRR